MPTNLYTYYNNYIIVKSWYENAIIITTQSQSWAEAEGNKTDIMQVQGFNCPSLQYVINLL